MFLIRQPSDESLRAFLAAVRERPFSYAEVGATRDGGAPAGYVVDRNRARLGSGAATFERAVAAVRRWTMFDLGWVREFPRDAPIEPGTAVAVIARVGPVLVRNAARIVYTIDERTEGGRRFGFAYGTLPDHAERGEERFLIEQAPDGTVSYDIIAFSQPGHPLVRLGYPVARALQRRFACGSMRAMAEAVA